MFQFRVNRTPQAKHVRSVSRSGRPQGDPEPWWSDVEWLAAPIGAELCAGVLSRLRKKAGFERHSWSLVATHWVGWIFSFAAAAYSLVPIRNLMRRILELRKRIFNPRTKSQVTPDA